MLCSLKHTLLHRSVRDLLLSARVSHTAGSRRRLLRSRLRGVLRVRHALQLGDLGEWDVLCLAAHHRLRLQHHGPPHGSGHLPSTVPVPYLPEALVLNVSTVSHDPQTGV